jgi:hypothetical protein
LILETSFEAVEQGVGLDLAGFVNFLDDGGRIFVPPPVGGAGHEAALGMRPRCLSEACHAKSINTDRQLDMSISDITLAYLI